MSADNETHVNALATDVVGTTDDDVMDEGYVDENGAEIGAEEGGHDKVNGHAGSDIIDTGDGSDLAAGDMVGNEWQFVNGKWVYNPDNIDTTSAPVTRDYNDIITTGTGDDVLLGNGGNDQLHAGAGDDVVNAGTGNDTAFGGEGDDILNMEDGNDYAEGGLGDDIINAGDGDDLIYGDVNAESVLSIADSATTLEQYKDIGAWVVTETEDYEEISHSVETDADDTFEISFELAANLNGGHGNGSVEVLWNGEVIGTVSTSTGIYEKHTFEVNGQPGESELSFRVLEPEPDPNAPVYDFSKEIVSYDKTVTIDGQDVSVDAFAPGQSQLYQVIHGQFNVFDTEAQEYTEVGDDPGFKINSIGFNQEDDLIYGIAKSNGVDALGNEVSKKDLVMIDASGDVYRVGETSTGSYTGDFDDSGNLWAFDASLNSVKVIDVDNLDANGNPAETTIDLPNDMFHGQMCDISFCAADGMFYSVMPPSTNGGPGKVYQIDISAVAEGGEPVIKSVDITGTLYDGEMVNGMSKGAYGAVFLDGDGNLYYGLNSGDHDLGTLGEAQSMGGIYKVNVDWDSGQAYSEYMAEAEKTGSNDGAVDPRSADAFTDSTSEATVLLREIELTPTNTGGNDDLRGGDGDDTIFGNAGDDILHGGDGDDELSGDEGNDNMSGGKGDDIMLGGIGDDKMRGGEGNDQLSGGDGKDFINAGAGDDVLQGGAGNDKLVGGAGSDTIEGGTGNDHMWGGNWWKDGSSDTFVIGAGGGKDMIHDFETGTDKLDLSSYGLEFVDIQDAMTDQGWATVIDLSQLTGGESGDKLILKNVDAEDLDETSFIL